MPPLSSLSLKKKSTVKDKVAPKEPYKNRYCPPEFTTLLKRTKELREFSSMSISQIWDGVIIHEFQDEFADRSKSPSKMAEIQEEDSTIEDPITP